MGHPSFYACDNTTDYWPASKSNLKCSNPLVLSITHHTHKSFSELLMIDESLHRRPTYAIYGISRNLTLYMHSTYVAGLNFCFCVQVAKSAYIYIGNKLSKLSFSHSASAYTNQSDEKNRMDNREEMIHPHISLSFSCTLHFIKGSQFVMAWITQSTYKINLPTIN